MNINDQLLFKIATQQWKPIEQKIFFPILGGMHNLMYSVDLLLPLWPAMDCQNF